ncbi:hypothetical protein DPSP01_010926 [Paraphaeosphaeria sporulosa]
MLWLPHLPTLGSTSASAVYFSDRLLLLPREFSVYGHIDAPKPGVLTILKFAFMDRDCDAAIDRNRLWFFCGVISPDWCNLGLLLVMFPRLPRSLLNRLPLGWWLNPVVGMIVTHVRRVFALL